MFAKFEDEGKERAFSPFITLILYLASETWFGRHIHILLNLGSGCGSVGRAVTSDTRDPRFEPCHRRNFVYQFICQLYNRKDENKEKEAGNGPSLKKPFYSICALRVFQHMQYKKSFFLVKKSFLEMHL